MPPRIPPGRLATIGPLNMLATLILGRVGRLPKGHPPHVFATLARHRKLFRRWMIYSGALMPYGRLPREDTELVILAVARNTDCAYEWQHHSRIAVEIGMTEADVERVKAGPGATGWTDRQRAILVGCDDLHRDGAISDATWSELSRFLDEQDLIEFLLLVGHYTGLAMTLNSIEVELDPIDPGETQPAEFLKRGTRPEDGGTDFSRRADPASG